MPANTSPIFIKQGNFTPARITMANSTPDANSITNLVLLVTAAADGTRVDGVRFRSAASSQTVANAACVHRVYLVTGSAATPANYKLIGEVATGAVTRSATAIGATSIITFDQPIIMVTGQTLYVGQSVISGTPVNDAFDAIAFAGDY
jgi:hypothetical protein